MLPPPWNVGTRSHEYGGRSYLAWPASGADEFEIVFAHRPDQRLYRVSAGREPRPITPRPAAPGGLRYADLVARPGFPEVLGVRETHHADGTISRAVVAVPLDGSAAAEPEAIRELVTGADFFAAPVASPDGRQLAWISWNHPDMPWDASELWVAEIEDSLPRRRRRLLGGAGESVLAPQWLGDNGLYVISDRTGWWNLYRVDLPDGPPRPVCPLDEEFTTAPFELGSRPFAILADGRLAVTHGRTTPALALLDPADGALTDLDCGPYRVFGDCLSTDGRVVVATAAGPAVPAAVLRTDPATGAHTVLRRENTGPIDPGYLPTPREMTFSAADGHRVHALVYPPANPLVTGPAGASPPYVVRAHGGPTGQAYGVLDLGIAYFTSRGIGVLDVNYAGSTGYGRAYRESLRRQWGVADVADVIAAARGLVEAGLADGSRLAIRGASAGGWTALCAVTTGVAAHGVVFQAATSYFGVTDAESLARETHDFESHYLDGLLGPLPEYAAVYRSRSPLGHVSPRTCPVLLLHGADDPVIPPAQADTLIEQLAARHIPYTYRRFPGESHGFRRPDTVACCYQAEIAFYGTFLGFTPAAL